MRVRVCVQSDWRVTFRGQKECRSHVKPGVYENPSEFESTVNVPLRLKYMQSTDDVLSPLRDLTFPSPISLASNSLVMHEFRCQRWKVHTLRSSQNFHDLQGWSNLWLAAWLRLLPLLVIPTGEWRFRQKF